MATSRCVSSAWQNDKRDCAAVSIVVAVALVAGCRWLPPLLPLVCSSSQHGIEKLTVGTAHEPPGQLMLLLKFSLLLLPLLLQVNSATRFCFLLHCHGLVSRYAEIAHVAGSCCICCCCCSYFSCRCIALFQALWLDYLQCASADWRACGQRPCAKVPMQ